MSAYNILFQVNPLRNPFCRQALRQGHYSHVAVLSPMSNYTVDGTKLRRGFRDLTDALVPEAAWRGHTLSEPDVHARHRTSASTCVSLAIRYRIGSRYRPTSAWTIQGQCGTFSL
jgi:hypothetical protein